MREKEFGRLLVCVCVRVCACVCVCVRVCGPGGSFLNERTRCGGNLPDMFQSLRNSGSVALLPKIAMLLPVA